MNKPKKKIIPTQTTKKSFPEKSEKKTAAFVFGKENFVIMLIGLGLIVLGFLLMLGGNDNDPLEFSYEVFSFRRMTLAPILVLAGYGVEVFAIMKKPRD